MQHLPFLAANYSSEDPGFALQAASAARRELVFDPGEYAPDDAPHYDPAWFGFSLFAMPDKDMFRPDTDAAGHVQSSMSVEAARDQLPGDDTLANYWKYRAQSYSAFTLERRGPATLKWKITQGVWAGRELTLKGETSRFRFVEFSTDSIQDEDAVMMFVFPVGVDSKGLAQYYVLDIRVGSNVQTTDADVLSLSDVTSELVDAGSAKDYENKVFDAMEAGLKFEGAVPDTLLLYDFSAKETVKSRTVPYVNEFDHTELPASGVWACGPSSLTMGLAEVGRPAILKEVFDNTMRMPPDSPTGLDWQKAETYVNILAPHTAKFRWKDTWANIEANLAARKPVLLGNQLSIETTRGPGHVILLLGIGENADVKEALQQLNPGTSGDYYIVGDPAGHFFANPSGQHYGKVQPLRALSMGINYGGWFAIYPKEKLRSAPWIELPVLRTLTIDAVAPAVGATVHSPVTVVITDPLGRKTGIRPDGSILEEIPDSEYHVALVENDETGAVQFLPDDGKTVVIGHPMEGTYTAQLIGTGNGPFTFDLDIVRPDQPLSHVTFSGTASPGSVHTYPFSYPPGATTTAVVGRSVFYNNSSYDGNTPGPDARDDGAIATDKQALRPGQAASFANVTSYTRGINGIMIDVRGLPGGSAAVSAADFLLDVAGASIAPTSVVLRRGAGVDGSDRITLVLPDNTARNAWLRVTALANAVTGLAAADLFHFGNLAGETGDGTTMRVSALDLSAVKRAINTNSDITGRFDFNRDGRVNALDLAAVRGNLNHTLGAITASPAAPVPASPFFSAPAANLSGSFSGRRVWDEPPVPVLG